MSDNSTDPEKTPPADAGAKDRNAAEKVPEAAENMEHTLRRLTAEKERKRAKTPGLYR